MPTSAPPRRPIVWSKLRPPQPAGDEAKRSERVDDLVGSGARLWVVSAPAGFGKTTLMTQAADRLGHATAWVSVDEADRDATRFWNHVAAAVGERGVDVEAVVDALIRGDREQAVDHLVATVDGHGDPILLVLDDVHELQESPGEGDPPDGAASADGASEGDADGAGVGDEALRQLGRLLTHPPVGLTIALLSRRALDLPVQRLRARGDALELGADRLAFTPDEARQLFAAELAEGLIDPDDLARLIDATEGWPVGLRLAQLAIDHRATLAGHDGPDQADGAGVDDALDPADRADVDAGIDPGIADVVAAFASGSSPDVARYLAGEVLDAQGEELRNFLVETSILAEMTPGACDAVTARVGALRILRRLVSARVFTTLVDPASSTFRYHRVLRDFLRSRLAERSEGDVRELHRRAMRWYERNDDPDATIWHAVAAGEHGVALDVMVDHYIAAANAGEIDRMWRWVKVVGAEHVLGHPIMASMPAWASLNQHRYHEIEPWLESIALLPELADEQRIDFEAHAATVRAHRDRHHGDLTSAIRHSTRAAELARQVPGFLIAPTALGAHGVMLALTGSPEAREVLRQSIEGAQRLGESTSSVMSYAYLAFAVLDDDLDAAEAYADSALGMVTTAELERFHRPAMAWYVRSVVCTERGRVREAEQAAEQALAVAESGDEPTVAALAQAQRARIWHLLGRDGERRAALRAAEAFVAEMRGADLIAERVRRAENDTRFAPLDTTHLPVGARELTDRELAVLRLLPHGLSRRELASQLYVSENTVKTHLTSIRRKLAVPGRGDIVGRARELGLLDD